MPYYIYFIHSVFFLLTSKQYYYNSNPHKFIFSAFLPWLSKLFIFRRNRPHQIWARASFPNRSKKKKAAAAAAAAAKVEFGCFCPSIHCLHGRVIGYEEDPVEVSADCFCILVIWVVLVSDS